MVGLRIRVATFDTRFSDTNGKASSVCRFHGLSQGKACSIQLVFSYFTEMNKKMKGNSTIENIFSSIAPCQNR